MTLRGFALAPLRRKAIAIEASGDLLVAALMTRFPASIYTRQLGGLVRESGSRADGAPEAPHAHAAIEVGQLVAAVARHVPFRALCLQQAIAVRRMLRRRGISAEVCLGLDPMRVSAASQTSAAGGAAAHAEDGLAHAWVLHGNLVICGALPDLSRYAVVGRFV